MEKRTSTGLDENIAGLLCYVAGWVSGIVFLLIEKENKFVRYHAIQSIATFGVLTLAGIVLGSIPFVGFFFGSVIWVIWVILWIVLMIKAYQGKKYRVPWAGSLAERYVG